MKLFNIIAAISLLTLCACTSAKPSIKSVSLAAISNQPNASPIIQQVVKNSPAVKVVKPGDRIIAIDEKPVSTIEDVWSYFSGKAPLPNKVTIQRKSGEEETVSVNDVYDIKSGNPYVKIFENDKTYVLNKERSKLDKDIALQNNNEAMIVSSADYWPSYPGVLELRLLLHMDEYCKKCKFENIIVTDKVTKSPLELVSPIDVARTVYPYLTQPGAKVAVPAPTISGYNAVSNTYGNINGNIYRNPYSNYANYSGTYNANTYTNITPTYDYTAQNAALWNNIAVDMQYQRIANQDQARQSFVIARQGDLRLEKLEPGSIRNATLFYKMPTYSSGSFIVKYIVSGKPMEFEFSLPKV